MIPVDTINTKDILVAKDTLDYARLKGDKLKIALCEDALNDLLDRYSYHVCHTSQRREKDDYRNTARTT